MTEAPPKPDSHGGRRPPDAVKSPPTLTDKRTEFARLLVLAAVAAWLLHPFATNHQIGAGDALWYANMLADFVLQWRAGVFPVFAGQTIHAFNGAVYPLRVAPLYQHLAGVIDLLTGRRLGFFTLQHLVVITCGVAGLFSCYFALCAVAPRRRWPAAALAILYLSCPGVLATVYTQDLYMTWTAVPFLPLAVFGIVRTFQKDTLASHLWLAAPLAALWWAHSPIALWMTGVATFTQIVRLLVVGAARRAVRPNRSLLLTSFGVFAFALLAQYPFVSVSCLHTPGTPSAVSASLAHPEDIYANIRSVFPAILLPLSNDAMKLSDLQLGYGLWMVLVASLIVLGWTAPWRRRESPTGAAASHLPLVLLVVACLGLQLLLAPLPPTRWLWVHFPEVIKRITVYWPMQRFYPILAALLAFSGHLALGQVRTARRAVRAGIAGMLLLSCGWSLWESRQFIRAGHQRTASAPASEIALRPENLLLMNHSYGLFPTLPPNFSNGVMDPEAETRLLSIDSETPLPRSDSSPLSWSPLRGTLDANPGILDLKPTLHLAPGRRYTLTIDFGGHDYHGVLQFVGRSLFRQYLLPSSGNRLSFGTGLEASHTLSLWTTNPAGDDVLLQYIPTAPGARAADYADFGRFSFVEIPQSNRSITLISIAPFRALVRSTQTAWLETPRMYMPGYSANCDGRGLPIARSPRGFVMVPVAPRSQTIEIDFVGTRLLRLSYGIALVLWSALGAYVSGRCALLLAQGFTRCRRCNCFETGR